ncbi:MAG TPA: hypothetical protein VE398_00730 [Acidobacteriota bacterium]|nr:hypothetical protein [Acidobacteriota bacterium]
MTEVEIPLTEEEYSALNEQYPRDLQSARVGERATALAKIYFKRRSPGCSFRTPQRGADLKVEHNGETEQLEIKGTEAPDISWAKIKVSSTQSHELLSNGMPLYRIVSVYERHPRVFIMTCPEDFEMIPEPRWSVRARRKP